MRGEDIEKKGKYVGGCYVDSKGKNLVYVCRNNYSRLFFLFE